MKSTKNSGTGSLWGELPARENLKQEVITPDIIENIWRQVMEESNNADCDFQIDRQPEYIQLPMGNLHILNTINLHQQLRMMHAVIILLAHIGFEKSSNVAIETLTDIVDHFLRRMTLLMKAAYEQKDHGFPDILERVLLETGVDEAANKLQFEELDEFGNVYREVPTLQLLDPEMGFPPSLDAGFQMLYSLEQDELNNLEVEEEEVNVSDSPSGQRPDTSNDKKKS
ncbi:STAGA complex 65 subunit gamma [Eufriesea mexicana]|uniref:STAGA complex 65 subunit gamma n=1 Tax=Eufriesea mexicana TaxID=516756 RepID=A0A310SGQ8_9HYME|nr:STAGA complex 65 subunit gamma [Eufriesea mexicana]